MAPVLWFTGTNLLARDMVRQRIRNRTRFRDRNWILILGIAGSCALWGGIVWLACGPLK